MEKNRATAYGNDDENKIENKNVKKTLEAGAQTKRHSEGIRPKNPLHILKRFFAKYKFPFAGNCVRPAQNDGKLLVPQCLSNLVPFRPLSLPSPSVLLRSHKTGTAIAFHPLLACARGEGCKTVKNLFTYLPIHLFTLKKIAAFTLAEVLITLGIIGVVAAMTIPSLLYAQKAARLHSQFLKSYSTIQQAFRLMQEDDVSLDPASYTGRTFYKAYMKYLTGAFDCGNSGYANSKKYLPCYDRNFSNGKNYKSYDNNTTFAVHLLDDGQIAMQDGTLIMFENNAPVVDYIYVSVDLNGFNNPPNRAGYDMFTFQFIDEELKPMGAKGTDYTDMDKYCNSKVTNAYNGIACAQKAKDNADYFKELVKEFK